MKTRLGMTVLAFALAGAGSVAVAKGHGRGHDSYQRPRADQQRHRDDRRHDDRRHDARRPDDRRYHVVDGRRYPVVVRDGRAFYVRDGRYLPVVIVRDDGRNRRYHPQSGHWDNGRRGPPQWARGRDYRSYGYERVIVVPVADYRRYDLYAPRAGTRWVRDDAGKYLLVDIATGVIRDILLRNL